MNMGASRGSIFRDALPIGMVEILLRLKGFIIMPMLTHYLGARDYGAWSQVVLIVSMFTPLVMLSTGSSFMRYASGLESSRLAAYTTSWLVFVVSSCLAAVIVLLAAEGVFLRLFFESEVQYRTLFVLAVLNLVLSCLSQIGRQWLLVRCQTVNYSLLSLLEAVVAVMVLVIAIVTDASLYEFVYWSVLGMGLVVAILLGHIALSKGFAKPNLSLIWPLVRYGIPLVPAGISIWGLNWIDRFVILEYMDMQQLGIYSFAYSLGYMVIPMMARPFRATYPSRATAAFNNGHPEAVNELFRHSAGTVVLLLIPAVIGLSILSPYLVHLLAPEEFAPAAPLIGWVGLGYTFNVLASYYAVQLGFFHLQVWATLALGMAALLNLALNVILIPRFGLLGAAIATAVAFFLQLLVVYLRGKHLSLLREDWSYVFRVILSAMLMGVVIYSLLGLVNELITNNGIMILIGTSIGTLVYALLAHQLRLVPDVTLLRSHITALWGSGTR